VKSADLIALLQEFFCEKHGLRDRHVAGAHLVSSYEFNNTYQYIINREEAQLSWLRRALEDEGAAVPADWPASTVPAGKGAALERATIEEDVRLMRAFRDRWSPRLDAMTHARHRAMLRVILGETDEQIRFFEQMIEGREDVLGRRMPGASTGGGVLSTRWVE
jgi:hypothetical protein